MVYGNLWLYEEIGFFICIEEIKLGIIICGLLFVNLF